MIIPPGFINVFARYTNADGHRCENAMAYDVTDIPVQSDADDISDTLAPLYKAQLDSGSRYDGVHILIGQDAGDPLVLDSTSSSGAGAGGAALCPPNVQGLIRKKTGLSGRHGRGRMYIGDMRASEVNSQGNMGSTPVARLQAIGDGWYADVPVAVTVITQAYLLHNDSTPPTIVTSTEAQSTVATQRRRLER